MLRKAESVIDASVGTISFIERAISMVFAVAVSALAGFMAASFRKADKTEVSIGISDLRKDLAGRCDGIENRISFLEKNIGEVSRFEAVITTKFSELQRELGQMRAESERLQTKVETVVHDLHVAIVNLKAQKE
jgi:cell division protein FtsL